MYVAMVFIQPSFHLIFFFQPMQDAKMPTFSRTMRETLVKGEQLTDGHIDLAQRLLKKQFHHLDGLQPP